MKLTDFFGSYNNFKIPIKHSVKFILHEGIRHPEDLIFDEGSVGAARAIDNLIALEKEAETIKIKWDGFPALIFGRTSDGSLVISDKNMFNKIDKESNKRFGMTTSSLDFENYDKNRGADRRDLWEKEKVLRVELEKIIPDDRNFRNKFYFGDLLWCEKLTAIDGYFSFTPNTVTYKIREDSELGTRIKNSYAGIAVHTLIPGLGMQDIPLNGIGDLPNNTSIVFLSGDMEEIATINVNEDLINFTRQVIKNNGYNADQFIETLISMKSKSVISAMKTFLTSKISEGNFDNLKDDFLKYLSLRVSDKAYKILLNDGNGWLYKGGAVGLDAVWKIWASVVDLKLDIKKQIDVAQHDPLLPVRAYTGDDIGHEGYVIGQGQQKIKLIDRLGFSKANFAKTRSDPKELFKKSTMPMASFCFGRMNPPTLGHKLLLEKTIQLGNDNSFIFLSSSHDSIKNPLDYYTKIEFIKKIFPEYSKYVVDIPVINPIYAANWLYENGWRNITFVAGSDRLGNNSNSLETILKKWNSGDIRTADYKFGPSGREEVVLTFVSSGNRDPDSDNIDGYSASKAREAAKENNEELFYKITGISNDITVNNKNLYQLTKIGLNLYK